MKDTKIFVSDLHLGDGTRTEDFHRTDEFLKLIDIIEAEAGRLIIVGDLLELWQADLDKVISCHDRIIKRLLILAKDERLTYIIGNHDHIPFVRYLSSQLRIQLEFKDGDNGIWAEHGNQYDIFNRFKDPRLALCNRRGRTIAYLTGWLERIVHPDIDEWAIRKLTDSGGHLLAQAAKIKNALDPFSKEYVKRGGNLSEYEAAALKLIDGGKRVVVFGHTHQPLLKRLGNGIYANSGSWCGRGDPTYIRVEGAKVELVNGLDHTIMSSIPRP